MSGSEHEKQLLKRMEELTAELAEIDKEVTEIQANGPSKDEAAQIDGPPPNVLYEEAMEYLNGEFCDKCIPVALDYLEKSAKRGYGLAQFQLAKTFAEGVVREQNKEQALYWARMGAFKGDAKSQDLVGTLLQEQNA